MKKISTFIKKICAVSAAAVLMFSFSGCSDGANKSGTVAAVSE